MAMNHPQSIPPAMMTTLVGRHPTARPVVHRALLIEVLNVREIPEDHELLRREGLVHVDVHVVRHCRRDRVHRIMVLAAFGVGAGEDPFSPHHMDKTRMSYRALLADGLSL